MSKIYLVNVGANTAHSAEARAPLFPDDRFHFVSFPDADHPGHYPRPVWPFVRNHRTLRTHADPDWGNLTYGDNCYNQRAKALLSVGPGDVLLFWALFWKVAPGENIFAADGKRRRWCLLGALAVSQAITARTREDVHLAEHIQDRASLRRALKNAHVVDGKLLRVSSKRHEVLFIGGPDRSMLFEKAVDLGIYVDDGLLRKTVRSKTGQPLEWVTSPRWNSSLRSCRVILDLSDVAELVRTKQLGASIRAANPGFTLF